VIDRDTYCRLQDVIRRQARSFLQYTGESFPWSTPPEQNKAEQLKQLAAEEREGVAKLSRYLTKQHLTPPYLGPYPAYFTSYNYLSLDRVVPLIVQHQTRELADLETDLKELPDGSTRKQVEEIVSLKRRHLQALQSLANSK
jgi:hypothetical protein